MNDTETDKHKRGREVTIKKDRSSELVFLVRERYRHTKIQSEIDGERRRRQT